ncbi:BMP family lipoprotein [Paenibacillus bovis]|uniref:BMP family ABC transporter substrate-binding protein n=1 Tax=Paenibacillus bovis TaxID=1616788 RepID=A0A172ZKI7_9BACL|nr:BMP family ABC transporter substrate-binding protein [Paenibacillus bovis]ANF97922.1 BMP family ABC transporter substrate-binding protein [Paenibacillus bovis]
MILVTALLLSACSGQKTADTSASKQRLKVGIVLSDIGLGDQSFSDGAFKGLIKARDEGDILFDYKEIADTGTYDEGFEQLVKEGNDIIIGLGYSVKDSLEATAKKHPDRQFLLIDEKSELANVASITFKEEEGSFLAGALAAMASKSGHLGFIGGVESSLLHKFQIGYEQGARAINPNTSFSVNYTGDFGKAELGAKAAKEMITRDNADVIYTVAGLTGVGGLQEAQKEGKYSIGVDSDQFFLAEKSVIASMVKNIDVAIYNALQTYMKSNASFPEKDMVFGLQDGGVGLTQIHLLELTKEQQAKLEELQQKLISGEIKINIPSS